MGGVYPWTYRKSHERRARPGLWKKAFGLAKPEEIVPIVDSVVNDRG